MLTCNRERVRQFIVGDDGDDVKRKGRRDAGSRVSTAEELAKIDRCAHTGNTANLRKQVPSQARRRAQAVHSRMRDKACFMALVHEVMSHESR